MGNQVCGTAPPTTWPDLIGDDPCIQDSRGFWSTAKYAMPCTPPVAETTAPVLSYTNTLPSTGTEGTTAGLALAFVMLGAAFVRLARR